MGFKPKISTPPAAPAAPEVVSTSRTDLDAEEQVKRKKKKQDGYAHTLLSPYVQGTSGEGQVSNRSTLG